MSFDVSHERRGEVLPKRKVIPSGGQEQREITGPVAEVWKGRRVLPERLDSTEKVSQRGDTDQRSDRADVRSVHEVKVVKVEDLGVLPLSSEHVTTRDGGNSAVITDHSGKKWNVYFFGDTAIRVPENNLVIPGTPWNICVNTGAIAPIDAPIDLRETVNKEGHPSQFVRFASTDQPLLDELAKIRRRRGEELGKSVANPYLGIWPGSPISGEKEGGYVFANRMVVDKSYYWSHAGVVLASVSIENGYARTERIGGLLFEPSEPSFAYAMVDPDQKMVYSYGQLHKGLAAVGTPYAVTRVPLEHVARREAYEFWNGNAWTPEVKQAAPILRGFSEALSVSFNAYLDSYIAIGSLPGDNQVFMMRAACPEGPWSEPRALFKGREPVLEDPVFGKGDPNLLFNSAAVEHSGLAQENTIVVSYYNPRGLGTGPLIMNRVTLAIS